MSDTTLEELDLLLREERTILLAGELHKLGPLAAAEESLFARLGSAQMSRARLGGLKREVERNRQLLAAAARGLNRSVAASPRSARPAGS